MGGGPSDLTFPAQPFLGRWDVTSTLIKVDLPLGPDYVPDMQVRCSHSTLPATAPAHCLRWQVSPGSVPVAPQPMEHSTHLAEPLRR